MVIKPNTQHPPRLPIVWVKPDSLIPYEDNARIHSPRQIKLLVTAIKASRFINPMVIDKNNEIVAGHGRLMAAKTLGYTEVPTICVEHLTPEQVKAYRIADNRLAELAEWDKSH